MRHVGVALALWLAVAGAQAQPSLQTRQSQAQQDRADLRRQIDALQKRIESSESARQDASAALQDSEQAISDISRRLNDLEQRHQALEASLRGLRQARQRQDAEFERQRQALADQLRAQHASGLSPWTALLSGRDPQDIGRELAYLAYVSQARTRTLKALESTVARLAELQQQTDASQTELETVQADTLRQQQELQDQQAQRRTALAQVQARLKDEKQQAGRLQARDARLGELLQSLDAEIAREQARREAARKAEAERQAKARAEQARREQEAQAARRQAEREQAERDQQSAEQTRRMQAERAQQEAAQEAARQPEKPAAPRVAAEPDYDGLEKGLPRPVAGETQGRFGAQRPDGGLWRGIVLRAAAGAPVRAVAPGRVVYAHWLAGFGNLLIIDHGRQFLSIYGYNQTVLKQVGDRVGRGDVVARVGATGGQVEPGLYFELRHEGAPVNPQLWLQP